MQNYLLDPPNNAHLWQSLQLELSGDTKTK